MNTSTPPTLKRLWVSVCLYMAIAFIAGVVAIVENLPAEFGGSSTGLTVTQDFIYGMGTALSPPLYTLIIQTAFLLLIRRSDQWGTVGVLGLTAVGLMTCIGALSEPINLRILNPATFDPVKVVIMTSMILMSVVIVALGVKEWLRRRRGA